MPSVCFVCLGNICRSPMAHAIALHLLRQARIDDWQIDSCGTGAWHLGKPADHRASASLARQGISRQHCARQLCTADYHDFDFLLAMDAANLHELHERQPPHSQAQIARLGDYDPQQAGDVSDPYYGGDEGFEIAYRQIERSCRAFFTAQGLVLPPG